MAVVANAAAVKNRLARMRSGLFAAGEDAAKATMSQTISNVENSFASSAVSSLVEQVGFDPAQFFRNIQPIIRVAPGLYGILDVDLMGTASDFEEIAGVKGLWHQGSGSGQAFRRRVFENPIRNLYVSAQRRRVWAPRTPQWILLEYGGSNPYGIPDDGAMNAPLPPLHFIENTKLAIIPTFFQLLPEALRRHGII